MLANLLIYTVGDTLTLCTPLRYSVNETLDGYCDHCAMSGDKEFDRHAAQNIAQADTFLW